MLAIFKRELRSCFHGMIGAVLTAFMLAATAIYFVALNLGYGLPDFGYYTLSRTIFVLLLYIPVLTMRSFAEERHSRTDQLLLTSPVSVGGIVLGKYFALCVIFALPCLVDAGMILVLKVLGATGTSTLANFSALLCYYLMGCAAIAIGVFLSSLTENQIIAAVSGVAALLLAYMMPSLRTMFTTGSAVALALFTAIAAVLSVVAGLRSKSFTLGCLSFAGCCVALTALFLLKSSWLTEAFSAVLSALCLFTPFEEFVNNSFSLPTLVYYLSVTGLFLFCLAVYQFADALYGRDRKLQIVHGVLFAFLAYFIWKTQSRNALLVLIAFLVLAVVLFLRKKQTVAVGKGFCALMAVWPLLFAWLYMQLYGSIPAQKCGTLPCSAIGHRQS